MTKMISLDMVDLPGGSVDVVVAMITVSHIDPVHPAVHEHVATLYMSI